MAILEKKTDLTKIRRLGTKLALNLILESV